MGIFVEKWSLKRSGQVGVAVSSVWSFIFFVALCAAGAPFFSVLPSIALFWAFGSLVWGILIYWFVGNWNR